MAIASKGWSEHTLKWEISFINLMMYALCIPPYDSGDSKSSNDKEPVDMFSLFDGKE
jgi:hypothetical protein